MLRPSRPCHLPGIFALGAALALANLGPAAPWTEITTDQVWDPAIRFGSLPNGLRYVIRPNATPQDRVSLRLLVSAGSLVERDDERGLAHFVEHMAFRGTQAYPKDTLVSSLQRVGIGLGPDNTAFTSYDFTVYHLELPDAKPASLRLGLTVFREYATALTFTPEAIEKERGVVLSEKDARNTPPQRLFEANVWSLWPDSRYYRRSPIGLESAIRHFTRDQFVAFYDAWYRPERMAIIVVGNVTTAEAEKLIAEILGPITARAPARPEPPGMIPDHATKPDVAMFVDDGLGGVRFNFSHPHPRVRPPDVHAEHVAQLYRSLAFAMFSKRLDWATRRRGASYVAPSVIADTFMSGWEVVSFSAAGRAQNWRELAAQLEQEHRRAYLLGFTEDELKLAKAGFARNAEQTVRSADTVRSEVLAGQIGSVLLYGGTITTPEVARDDLAPELESATVKQCSDAFRAAWGSAPAHVLVTTNSLFTATRSQIGAELNRSRQNVRVQLRAPPEDVAFHYRYFGDPGKLTQDDYHADLDVHLGRFANGVGLNFKPTTFQADSVNVVVRVGTGKLSQPENQPGLDLFASYGLINGGLVLHSSEELDALLSHHVLNVQFAVEPDACVFYAQCARRDLLLAMQMIAAYMKDAAYRPSTLPDIQASLGSYYSNFDATSGGVITRRAERVLAAANSRVGAPEPDEAYARNFGELSRWLAPQFGHGAIELSIVGDTNWSEASDAVSRTLGALAPRNPYPKPGKEADIHFATPSKFPQLFALDPRVSQTAIAWYWPVPDVAGAHEDRRCRLLAAVLNELLFMRLREELGVSYTPGAEFVRYEGWPTFSYFTLRADVASAQGPKAAQVMRGEIERLLAHGIDDDVFLRANHPFMRSREEDLRSNSYWSNTVLSDAQLRPERLLAARDRAADTAAISRQDLEGVARRYLAPARGFLFIAEPGPTANWAGKYYWDAK